MRIARSSGVSKEVVKPRRGMSLRPKLPEPPPPIAEKLKKATPTSSYETRRQAFFDSLRGTDNTRTTSNIREEDMRREQARQVQQRQYTYDIDRPPATIAVDFSSEPDWGTITRREVVTERVVQELRITDDILEDTWGRGILDSLRDPNVTRNVLFVAWKAMANRMGVDLRDDLTHVYVERSFMDRSYRIYFSNLPW